VPAIIQQPHTNTKSFHPGLDHSTSQKPIESEVKQSVCPPVSLGPRDYVFHEDLGLGRVLRASTGADDEITVSFDNSHRTVSTRSLRPLLPRSVVGQLIKNSTPNVSAWMVRKADKQGAIVPDLRGRFAGHAVHYYDVARIPYLIQKLSEQDAWKIGTLVFHPEYGPGAVVVGQSGRTESGRKVVQFFSDSSRLLVNVQQLRRLVSSRMMASRLGLNRKTFSRLARRKGVFPDYVTSGSRVREFYDEGRIEEILERWSVSTDMDSFPSGCLVVDRHGEVAKVEYSDFGGQLQLRYLHFPGSTQSTDPASVRKLASLRELARSEQMSRYKLNRLLTAAGVRPVYQGGQAIYFDGNRAREAVRARLGREASAVSLATLAIRTGISKAVLAKKVRQGCIGTTGEANHAVDVCEAERIEAVVRAFQSRRENVETTGICQLRPRGRTGHEVAVWDLAQLIRIALPLTPLQRVGWFRQVAWLCDGAGRHRLIESLNDYILSHYKIPGDAGQLSRGASVLLALLGHLPPEFNCYRSRLMFLASGVLQVYGTRDELRNLAGYAGLHGDTNYQRFQAQINESVADLLTRDGIENSVGTIEPLSRKNACLYPEDDFVRGAVIVCLEDTKPAVGLIVRVERQAWNAALRGWDKTVVVRFTDEERRLNPRARTADEQQRKAGVVVLLRAAETKSVLHKIGERPTFQPVTDQAPPWKLVRKAS
jgi:hypothetical protein